MMRLHAAFCVLVLAACSDPAPEPVVPPTTTPTPAAAETPQTPPPAPDGPYFATPAPGEELPTSQTTPGPIPLQFRHVWAIEPADCTRAPGLTRIAIAPGAIRFYEGRAVVVNAEVSGDTALILDVDHASEGETTRERHNLQLDPGYTRLTYQRRDSTFIYVRCD